MGRTSTERPRTRRPLYFGYEATVGTALEERVLVYDGLL